MSPGLQLANVDIELAEAMVCRACATEIKIGQPMHVTTPRKI